jgi:hypothetical protein
LHRTGPVIKCDVRDASARQTNEPGQQCEPDAPKKRLLEERRDIKGFAKSRWICRAECPVAFGASTRAQASQRIVAPETEHHAMI